MLGSGGAPGVVDITGKVTADAHVTTDVNTRFTLVVPDGFAVRKDFESKVTKVDNGTSMIHTKAASNGRAAGPN